MQQISKYTVESLGVENVNILNSEDSQLVGSRTLGSVPFDENRYTVDLSFYDLNENFIETYYNISSYSVLGEVQGHKPHHIVVDPEQDTLSREYLGDVILKYEVFNDLFRDNKSEVSDLFIEAISADRTEIRAKSTYISNDRLRSYAETIYEKVHNAQYFSEFYLNFFDSKLRVVGVNITTEVVGQDFYVTFKTYNPLPVDIVEKARFTVLERIGEPSKFRVRRYVEIVEDPVPYLKGPNFEARVIQGEQNTTEYLNYNDLFSFPVVGSYFEKFAKIGEKSATLSINYEDFGDFIHFSSAVERLLNFKYKMDLLEQYNLKISSSKDLIETLSTNLPNTTGTVARLNLEIQDAEKQVRGLVSNFDHYERYLYFESGSHAWPKTGAVKPYTNVPSSKIPDIDPAKGIDMSTYLMDLGDREEVFDREATQQWYDLLEDAEAFDNTNADMLVGAIPFAIREAGEVPDAVSRLEKERENEPYIMFVHMLGQHFDDIWVYIDNITERYNNDNRPNFGISRDLIRDAIEHLGVDLSNSNQNLDELFENFKIVSGSEIYDFGKESPYVSTLISTDTSTWPNSPIGEQLEKKVLPNGQIESEEDYQQRLKNRDIRLYSSSLGQQPVRYDTYLQEVYRRIYSNIPYLIKTKGTQRGLRALINCFGIPDDILEIEVLGGIKVDSPNKGYFGPLDWKVLAKDRVRVDNSGGLANYTFNSTKLTGERIEGAMGPWTDNLSGSDAIYVSGAVASEYVSVRKAGDSLYSDDSHEVNVGFNLAKEANIFISKSLSPDWDYDDIVGDPRNHKENYNDAFLPARQKVLPEDTEKRKVIGHRPADIIRLVRYFDTLLFRALKNFIPAKAITATGAIIDDNFLHRNRFKGVDLVGEDLTKEGGFHVGAVTGSHGGSFRRTKLMESPKWYSPFQDVRNRSGAYSDVRYNRWHTSRDIGIPVPEDIFADQPKYNGEFSGSVIVATDHLRENKNPYYKDLQPIENFAVGFVFMGLPEPPTCEITGKVGYEYELFRFWTTLAASLSFSGPLDNFTIPTKAKEYYYARATATTPVIATAWTGSCTVGYEGWRRTVDPVNTRPADWTNGFKYVSEIHTGSSAHGSASKTNNPTTGQEDPTATIREDVFLTPRPDYSPVTFGDDFTFEARYYNNFSQKGRLKLWLEDWKGRHYGYGYGYYYFNPLKLYYRFDDCNGTSLGWDLPGPVYIKFLLYNSAHTKTISRIAKIERDWIFGTEEGVVIDLGLESDPELTRQVEISDIVQYGVYEMHNHIGPFLAGNPKKFYDADWYDCFDLWIDERNNSFDPDWNWDGTTFG